MSFDETKLFVLTVKSLKETNMFKILCKWSHVLMTSYIYRYWKINSLDFIRMLQYNAFIVEH